MEPGLTRSPAADVDRWRWCLLLGVLAAVPFALPTAPPWLAAVTWTASYAAATGLLVRRWLASRARRQDRILPVAVVAACSYLLADLGFCFYPLLADRALPVPSVVDALYLSSYALFGSFLVMLARRHSANDQRGVLDAVIVTLGLLPLGYILLAEPLLGGGVPSLTQATFLAYPAAVGVLLVLGLWVAFDSGRRDVPYLLLLGWLVCEQVPDVLYSVTGVDGSFRFGQWWQGSWVLSSAFLGALALHPDSALLAEPSQRPARSGRGRLPLVGAALLTPVATLIWVQLSRRGPSRSMSAPRRSPSSSWWCACG